MSGIIIIVGMYDIIGTTSEDAKRFDNNLIATFCDVIFAAGLVITLSLGNNLAAMKYVPQNTKNP